MNLKVIHVHCTSIHNNASYLNFTNELHVHLHVNICTSKCTCTCTLYMYIQMYMHMMYTCTCTCICSVPLQKELEEKTRQMSILESKLSQTKKELGELKKVSHVTNT